MKGVPAFPLRTKGRIGYVAAASLEGMGALRHYFVCRKGGVSSGKFAHLNLSAASGDDERAVKRNRTLMRDTLGLPRPPLHLKQVHGNRVLVVDESNLAQVESSPVEGDAMVTGARNVPLAVLTADCPSIVMFDPVGRVLGVAHAGWRGTASGIVRETVAVMKGRFGVRPGNIIAAIGPSIAAACYEVGMDVRRAFVQGLPFAADVLAPAGDSKWHADLREANRRQLLDQDVRAQGISTCPYCTHCELEWFYSARRDRDGTGRNSTVAYLA